jgi:hypothetical protein
MGFREAGVLSSGDKSLAACASKLPVIIGMVSADHTEVGERVLQPRQQRREQWGALCNGGNRLAGSAKARRGGRAEALNVVWLQKERIHSARKTGALGQPLAVKSGGSCSEDIMFVLTCLFTR